MNDALDIAEVARRTGLTSRTLRFHETRGLMTPLRSHNGRRYYGRDQLERIGRIVALRKAGLGLAQIGRMMAERGVDLVDLVDEQIQALARRKAEIGRAQQLLVQAVLRFEPGEAVDLGALCDSIRQGVEQQAAAEQRLSELFDGLDFQAIRGNWIDLQQRIEAALPLDPAGEEAQALCDEAEQGRRPSRRLARSRHVDEGQCLAASVDQGLAIPHRREAATRRKGERQGAGFCVKGRGLNLTQRQALRLGAWSRFST